MTFQVTILFGLGFIVASILNFYYDRFIGISRMSFLAAILNWNFGLRTSNFRSPH